MNADLYTTTLTCPSSFPFYYSELAGVCWDVYVWTDVLKCCTAVVFAEWWKTEQQKKL